MVKESKNKKIRNDKKLCKTFSKQLTKCNSFLQIDIDTLDESSYNKKNNDQKGSRNYKKMKEHGYWIKGLNMKRVPLGRQLNRHVNKLLKSEIFMRGGSPDIKSSVIQTEQSLYSIGRSKSVRNHQNKTLKDNKSKSKISRFKSHKHYQNDINESDYGDSKIHEQQNTMDAVKVDPSFQEKERMFNIYLQKELESSDVLRLFKLLIIIFGSFQANKLITEFYIRLQVRFSIIILRLLTLLELHKKKH